jgi:hypothetical protein
MHSPTYKQHHLENTRTVKKRTKNKTGCFHSHTKAILTLTKVYTTNQNDTSGYQNKNSNSYYHKTKKNPKNQKRHTTTTTKRGHTNKKKRK